MKRADWLLAAVKTAIAKGTPRSTICVPAWAATYGVTQKAVREAWESALTNIPPNSDYAGEGK